MKKVSSFWLIFVALSIGAAVEVSAQDGERARLAKLLGQCLANEARQILSEGWKMPHEVDRRLEAKCSSLERSEREAFAQELAEEMENEPSREKRIALATFQLIARDMTSPRKALVWSYTKLLDDRLGKDDASKPQRR